jgi:hypothetical protein
MARNDPLLGATAKSEARGRGTFRALERQIAVMIEKQAQT